MPSTQSRAQISRDAIQRLYIAMRHLFIRGSYKPLGASGEAIIQAMLSLSPEIYGSIRDTERVELDGLLYIFQRLPLGIEECRYVKLIGREGYEKSDFQAIIPAKRRRSCYRIDEDQMFIEMSRGRSDVYDVLTHLTFLYIESEKIRLNALDHKDRVRKEWEMLREIVELEAHGEEINREVGYSYLSNLLGRTYEETEAACERFDDSKGVNSLFHITYWMGRLSLDEHLDDNDREISFSRSLREKLGHHIYGETWAEHIKKELHQQDLLSRPIHIISSNMHSVMNSLYGHGALGSAGYKTLEAMAESLSLSDSTDLRKKVEKFALSRGMAYIHDHSGTNITVQIIDCKHLSDLSTPEGTQWLGEAECDAVILVMDYAFGEQAYETMDELLKPMDLDGEKVPLDVRSINIMGKAGILEGVKGDIMIPTAHVFEGTADNYPVDNALSVNDLSGHGLTVYEGPMITVMGTSLQNRDVLNYFLKSSWSCIGLEMEGAHYQKAIQAASKIRKSIRSDVTLRYAYYASDNPLHTGGTLASGSLGVDGVKPTYLITDRILKQILRV